MGLNFKINGETTSENEAQKAKDKRAVHAGSESEPGCQIDDLIGHFGKYQLLIFMFKILIGVTSAFNNLGVTFFAPSNFIAHWCANKSSSNLDHVNTITSSPINGSHFIRYNEHLAKISPGYMDIFNGFLANDQRFDKHHNSSFDSDTPKSIRRECDYYSAADNTRHKCESFEYDTGIWISTIIDEWDLVCDRSWMISMTQSLYMSGFLVSYPIFGYISDRFGRWHSLLIGALIEMSSGFGCAFAGSVTTFMMFRFLVGLGNAGRTSSSYLVMIEWVGPKWRMHISTLGSLGWMVGYCAMPWIEMYFLHFRHMQLFACFYELIFIVWLLRVPESPRWLLTHRRFSEAHKVLLMAAKFNGLIKEDKADRRVELAYSNHYLNTIGGSMAADQAKTVTTSITNGFGTTKYRVHKDTEASDSNAAGSHSSGPLQAYTMDEFNRRFNGLVNTIHAKEFSKNEDHLTVLDLFMWQNLRKYLLILFYVWATNSFVYYGIVLRVGDFGGNNLFVSFTIAGLTEIPSMVFTIVCMKFLPRRTTNSIIYCLTALLCASQFPLKYYNFTALQQPTIMLAKISNACAFTCILYQTMELFPTSIRQTAYSSCSLAGRVGSILAPFVKELAQKTNDSVPPVLYALLSAITVILIRALPETKGADLHDTLMEAEKFEGTDKSTHSAGTTSSAQANRIDQKSAK